MSDARKSFKSQGGAGRLLDATRYSLAGYRRAFRQEAAFRQELALLLIATAIAVWLDRPLGQTALLVGSVALVLVVELLNSAIEAVVDLVSPHPSELAGAAKDFGSAAVMTSLFLALGTWLAVLL